MRQVAINALTVTAGCLLALSIHDLVLAFVAIAL